MFLPFKPQTSVHILCLGQSLWNIEISHSTTTSFHLQSNRMTERFHGSIKSFLWARLAWQDWVQHLPFVFLGLKTTPKEDSGYAPAEALFGNQLSVPGEFLDAPDLPPLDFLKRLAHSSSYPSCSHQTSTQDQTKFMYSKFQTVIWPITDTEWQVFSSLSQISKVIFFNS